MTGVSFVVPVHNGALWIADVLASIDRQADGRPLEIVVVDDGSSDASVSIVRHLDLSCAVRVLVTRRHGMAAALNTGIQAATHPIVCQVDQDVVLQPGWMRALVDRLDAEDDVAAAQGCYEPAPDADVFARVSGVDLRLRYGDVPVADMDHVCTGNVAYRVDAVRAVGLFDAGLGYGLDNDLSYRLREAGHRLVLCREARSTHHWRTGLLAYARQQYGLGYGRLDLVAKHPRRVSGDVVSPTLMMLHPLLTGMALLCLLMAAVSLVATGTTGGVGWIGLGVLGVLAAERGVAALRASLRFREPVALLFPIVHLVRDLSWVVAIAVWLLRRTAGRVSLPADSMRSRPVVSGPDVEPRAPSRVLVLVLAHNEADTLRQVVDEIRSRHAGVELLVVDDGSTDATPQLVEDLGVRWLRLPERMGVGSAVRAGLRYASRSGFDGVVRVDGDGQHRADEIERVVAPLLERRADVVLGSRYTTRRLDRPSLARFGKHALAACLSLLTGRAVTDPTSGFCAMGPRAVRMFAEHHPTGYPEPELHLLASQHGLRVVEVPVVSRERQGGRTSLTPWRLMTAAARVALAMVIVPLRGGARGLDAD